MEQACLCLDPDIPQDENYNYDYENDYDSSSSSSSSYASTRKRRNDNGMSVCQCTIDTNITTVSHMDSSTLSSTIITSTILSPTTISTNSAAASTITKARTITITTNNTATFNLFTNQSQLISQSAGNNVSESSNEQSKIWLVGSVLAVALVIIAISVLCYKKKTEDSSKDNTAGNVEVIVPLVESTVSNVEKIQN